MKQASGEFYCSSACSAAGIAAYEKRRQRDADRRHYLNAWRWRNRFDPAKFTAQLAARILKAWRCQTRICKDCGTPFPVRAYGIARLTYCVPCLGARTSALVDAGLDASNPHYAPHPRQTKALVCPECGQSFRTDAVTARFCSESCGKASGNRVRRARRLQGTPDKHCIEPFGKAEIYARDQYLCQLCKTPVWLHVESRNPFAPTIDHIVPLARGGEHSHRNVQCAHLLCNGLKSDGSNLLNEQQMQYVRHRIEQYIAAGFGPTANRIN